MLAIRPMKGKARSTFKIKVGTGGYQDEIRKALIERTRGHGRDKRVRAMTVYEFMVSHCKRWGFYSTLSGRTELSRQPAGHEASHAILMLVLMHLDGKAEPFDYQGSFQSESIVLTIEALVNAALLGNTYKLPHSDPDIGILMRREFISRVKERFISEQQNELYERTIAFRLCELNPRETYHSLRRKASYTSYSLERIARSRGLAFGRVYRGTTQMDAALEALQKTGVKLPKKVGLSGPFWVVDSGVQGKPYTSGIWSEDNKLVLAPNIPTDRPGFMRYTIPDEERIGAIFDRVLPAIEVIHKASVKVYKGGLNRRGANARTWADEIFKTILISDLNAAIGKAPYMDLQSLENRLRMESWKGQRHPFFE